MLMKRYFSILALVASSLLILSCGQGRKQNDEYKDVPPLLFIAGPTELDYGTVHDNEFAVFEHTFQLYNRGGGELKVEDVKANCGCFEFEYERRVLHHGEMLPVKMILDKRGNILQDNNYTIDIVSNDQSQTHQIKVHVNLVG